MDQGRSSKEVLGFLEQLIKKDFESNRRVLAFDEYLQLLAENPERQLRGSAKYMVDMMDRFDVFAQGLEDGRKIIGQSEVRNEIYHTLKTFVRQGVNNKLILLHGPNGSAKTSIAQAMMRGLERYSNEPEGAMYSFNWIFPIDKIQKGSLGLSAYSAKKQELASYARLTDEEIQCRIPGELRDHPLLLIPVENRQAFLEKLIGTQSIDKIWNELPLYLRTGGLSHRNRQIYDALLVAHAGDLRQVLMHVQVERFFFSRRYREGVVTIEPQMHVDASSQQLTMSKSIGSLPALLQGLNLFALFGDLVDGNRGLIEFSDLLKRPVDSFKYLLNACETNSVNVGSSIAYLDSVFIGSTNELQLDAFKEFPDFNSFKARIELIRVPYLTRVHEELQIYESDVAQISQDKHCAPHVAWAIALWAILTRLKKPNAINYPPNVSSIVSALSPLEKARLYDTGEMPIALTPEERKLLRSAVERLREEYENIPYYEGRMGASAREMRSILYGAAENDEVTSITPLSIFRELEEFVKRVTEYEFLKQDVKDGYHDAADFINVVKSEYLVKIDREVRGSIGLYDQNQWEDFIRKYVSQVSLVLKKEKTKNPITGKMEDPDFSLIDEFEKIVDAPKDQAPRDAFRQNMISQVGAWSLDHPHTPVVYGEVFPEYLQRLEKFYYETQKSVLTKMHNALMLHGTPDHPDESDEGAVLAKKTVDNMVKRLGYDETSAREVITFLMRSRYY